MTGFSQKILNKSYTLIENTIFRNFSFFTKKNTLLLIRLDSIGDYVLFRNFIQELKTSEKYKDYKITLCGNSWWKDLAENLDARFIDKFIWVDYNKLAEEQYRFRLHKEIFLSGFETVINPIYSRDIYSDYIVRYSGAKNKIGYDSDTINLTKEIVDSNNKFYTKLITTPYKYRFEFYRNKDFFEALLNKPITLKGPTIAKDKKEEKYIILFPGAKDPNKKWSSENFGSLASLLASTYPKLQLIICGSSSDSKMAAEIMKNTTAPVEDFTGKYNLMELLDIISAAKLVVGNDSGPFHLAVALNKNVICISNGHNYSRFTLYPQEMEKNSVVLYPAKVMAYTEEERLRKFYKMVIDADVNEITVNEVFSAITNHFKIN